MPVTEGLRPPPSYRVSDFVKHGNPVSGPAASATSTWHRSQHRHRHTIRRAHLVAHSLVQAEACSRGFYFRRAVVLQCLAQSLLPPIDMLTVQSLLFTKTFPIPPPLLFTHTPPIPPPPWLSDQRRGHTCPPLRQKLRMSKSHCDVLPHPVDSVCRLRRLHESVEAVVQPDNR